MLKTHYMDLFNAGNNRGANSSKKMKNKDTVSAEQLVLIGFALNHGMTLHSFIDPERYSDSLVTNSTRFISIRFFQRLDEQVPAKVACRKSNDVPQQVPCILVDMGRGIDFMKELADTRKVSNASNSRSSTDSSACFDDF